MKNIIVSVPDDVYRAAQIHAPGRASRLAPWQADISARSPSRKASLPDSRRSSTRCRTRSNASARATGSIATRFTGVLIVDTNVLLYAHLRRRRERDKTNRANEILSVGDLALSIRVLQEFYVQATRESRPDRLSHEQAAKLVESFLRFPVAPVTTGVMLAAVATCDRFRISYWDAAILEAARSLGCELVLSEDLSDGQDYAGVRVENPFRP